MLPACQALLKYICILNSCFQVFTLFLAVIARPEFSFPEDKSPGQRSISYSSQRLSHRDNDDPSPEGKHMHKTKKLKRKIRRLCLMTGGRSARSVTPEGKFFFPTIVQQTGVNVDVGPGYDDYENDHDSASGAVASAGAGSRLKCADLLNAGFFNDLHPFPQVLTGGGGGDDDDDSESKFYHKNFNRHVIRPLYRSMRKFYRLLTRR